ncbi:hypothetical protein BJV74DRAFT_833475 [Russula compacta]|nr:hypothetical protein BJV74DRAFT_833475 [Russula compacta]
MMATALPKDSTTPDNDNARIGKGEASASAQATGRHEEFYFTDEMTVFQVENRLFRVHRHFLAENSLVFSSMFSLPLVHVDGTPAEGTCDANPIHLSGVTELEFETLLRYFYKSMHDGFSLPQASWIALLSIAHRYEFLNVRERAIREIYDPLQGQRTQPQPQQQLLQSQQPQGEEYLMLISVAEKYDVPSRYIVPLLVTLVTRAQSLTEDEVASLSSLTVSRLAHAREDFVRRTASSPPPLGVGLVNGESKWRNDIASSIVCKIWAVQRGRSWFTALQVNNPFLP